MQAQLYCINYDVDDGLPSDNITTINEDANGYLYVGSSMGLSYFDGVDFTTLSELGEGDIPQNTFVEKIRFDSKGNVWIATEQDGLFRFEPQTKHWINFSVDASPDRELPINRIWDIEIINDTVYVSCENNGVLLIDISTLEIVQYPKFQENTITDIYKHQGIIYMTDHYSLYRISNPTHRIDTLFQDLTNFGIVGTYTLSDESIYILTYTQGIFKLDKNKLMKVSIAKDLDTWRYNFMFEYNNKQWLTLRNHGIASIDLANNSTDIYKSQAFTKHTLPKGKYHMGFKDSRNSFWIATSKGLCSIHPDLQAFKNIENEKYINEFLIEAIYDKERKQYVMLYASEKDKLKFYDEDFNKIAGHNHTPDVPYIQSLWGLLPYKGNYYCLGYDIMLIDTKSKRVSQANLPGLSNSKSTKAITLDDENNLWICDNNNKVTKYSLEKNKIIVELTLPKLDKSSDFKHKVRSISNGDKNLSICTNDLFIMIDKETYQMNVFDVDKESGSILKIDKYPAIKGKVRQVEIFDDSYYICTRDEGIYKADYSQEKSFFTTTHKLSTIELNGPTELRMDEQKDIWIASDNGLILTDKYLKIKKKIRGQNGLTKTKLSEGLSIANGKIILNNENGFTVADRTLLKKTDKIWPVDVQSVLVNNKSINLGEKNPVFHHSQKNIQFKVTSPFYENRSNYEYLYRLLPINKEWSEAKLSRGQFRFDNLQDNEYTFEIKTKSRLTESQITQFSFIITPPFWKTWWFLSLVSLLTLISVILIYRSRVRYKINQEKVKTRLAELQNEAIRAQLNPHFIFNALNSIRSLILMDRKDGSLNYLGIFSTLVREVLSISKEESISLRRELDFNDNYVNIERMRFSQSLTYDVRIEKELNIDEIYVPPLIMQPFIENAIWHGLLGKLGAPILTVDIKTENESLIISIDDNGTGRSKKQISSHKNNRTKKAFGELLSRQRLQSLGKRAEIKILDKREHEVATGTTVIIKLPLKL